jgi:cytochrome c oxidase subunit 4
MSTEAVAGGFGQGQGGESPSGQGDHSGHASPRTYWAIGGILTVITAMEVAAFYIPAMAPVLVPVLLVLSATKFMLVIMFFMHLRFDSKVFSGVFLTGMVLASFMTVALIVLFKVLPNYQIMG